MVSRSIRSLLLAVAIPALAACGGSGSDDPPADATAPSVPVGVSATATSTAAVDVTWTAATDTGGSGMKDYIVYRGGAAVGTVTTTSFADSGLAASTMYSYQISARDNANNESNRSTAVSVTTLATLDTAAPSVPMGLTTATQATSVALAWNASTDTGGSGLRDYRVYRNNTLLTTLTARTYTDTTVAASTAYSYQVSARDNALNESARSAASNVTTPAAATFGLDTRPPNTTCVAPARTVSSATIRITPAFNVTFTNPVAAVQAPGDNNRWFVVEKGGRIMVFNVTNPAPTVFLDLTSAINDGGDLEAGLLGLAFHPDFANNGRLYVFYTGDPNTDYRIQSRISEFTSANRTTVDRATERVLIRADKTEGNHNGGQLAFGPDDLLYASFGDGGAGDDPNGNGQSTRTLFGKIIRIDVNGTTGSTGYAIPPSNPYFGNATCPAVATSTFTNGVTSRAPAACPEIYAYGFRNPWRFSLDRDSQSPDLWVGDVGQGAYEEINRVQLGGNYGWDTREGPSCHEPSSGCTTAGMIDPIAAAPRDSGLASIIGGFVYRGMVIPSLVGRYLFTDFYTAGIYTYDGAATNGYTTLLDNSGVTASAFAEANDGELYLVDFGSGGLHRIEPGSGSGTSPVPSQLSQTGCVNPNSPTEPAAGLVPFAPNAPFWSDGAGKERWMALPNNTTVSVGADGDWTFPTGTVLMKNFRLQGLLIETRLFMHHPDGEWAGYTYQWNSAQTAATRVVGGSTVPVGGQNWIYPSEAQCLQCHTGAAGRSLGPETFQLNGAMVYSQTGRTANQITTLEHIGILPSSMPDASTLPVLPDPEGSAPLAQRARSYLHTNCSFCHRPGGGVPGTMDLRYTTTMSATNTCNATPSSGDLGVVGARIITPANPGASVLYLRMNRRGANQMPPVGSNEVDDAGAALIEQWILQMSGTCT